MKVKQSDPDHGTFRILFLAAMCSLLLIACSVFGQGFPPPRDAPATAPPTQAHAELESIKDTVMHRSQNNEQQVFAPSKTTVLKGDSVRLENDGQASVRFADALIVKLYYKGRLEVTGLPDANADPVSRVFLSAGAAFSESLSPHALAEQRVRIEIETPWAIIDEVGTRFLVYYDTSSGPLRDFTWVVVKEGAVVVADKAGHQVLVEAGQQTWVSPGNPPAQPIPATRAALEMWRLDFPRIEAISNGVEQDTEFLTQIESPTPSSVNKPAAPSTLQPAAEPLPTVFPTEVFTMIPAVTPTSWDAPVQADTTGPEFVSGLLYDKSKVFYPDCGGSQPVDFSIQVDDSSGVKSVFMDYLYQSGDSPGPRKTIEMAGAAPYFAATVDVGQEAFKELKENGYIYYWVYAVDSYGNRSDFLEGVLDVGVAPC